jgi:hypothetical protein
MLVRISVLVCFHTLGLISICRTEGLQRQAVRTRLLRPMHGRSIDICLLSQRQLQLHLLPPQPRLPAALPLPLQLLVRAVGNL